MSGSAITLNGNHNLTANSVLEEKYRRVINRGCRLELLVEMQAPSIVVRNEKRMLKAAMDDLFGPGEAVDMDFPIGTSAIANRDSTMHGV